MLVLTRKLSEVIKLNEDIEITVLSIEGGQVKLGIKAPKDVKVYRKEVYERIKEENQIAVKRASKSDTKELAKGLQAFKK